MTISRRELLAAGGTVLAVGLAGCNDGNSNDPVTTAPPTTRPPPADAAVEVDAAGFAPLRVSVDPGDRVRWENVDATAHDVTPDTAVGGAADWEFDAGTVEPGTSIDRVFEERGLYAYRCSIHGREAMCGAVVVGDVSVDTALPCQD
ncbi:cupredoxin domain-containing protein [Haloarchaeobius iranensis]|uniref:Copper binding protein, plastocyanin/azurin family n=1 Tax=Haloarchaeobius iranensis TaxID=996166 RepID=A0A1G9TP85_9EURY|nr:plastocyanin/azurin family copper-binding protein [Haloarchaeobius iranensis]SDM49462.1 Copper binding protein, plastocyanin/azurin family [Haloarchaeobius iranensis]